MGANEKTETVTFRVRAANGGYMDIDACNPNQAREIFKARYPKVGITKVKRLKEGAEQ
ncbi:protein of unknown function [Pseudorhizobium banfieldiae]|uniref:Uncharacterized protein n=1 Tax=Pseudorhizobium banfieldiae TaxID=1125847 RepID=L0ND96_9HYPH|nr:hypothetical protein [Pseudorhizobium banfieldiae]CAD6605884.1 hypothetical protein RNT25_01742 [arsenite-oxidising bacterium NT-25]CCF19088.1 protein of unknown function [Pseudorhizobium banfieldiae]